MTLPAGDQMSDADDDLDLVFADEEEPAQRHALPPWKILVADDDADVHAVTKLIFEDFVFKGRRLEFIDAYSGDETCRLLVEHPDTAVILLDVVMESDHAGLRTVERIREEIGNPLVRVILRTGQPGQAPEERVILDYDINDYKAKSELTSQKLLTSLVTALRSFNDLKSLDAHRRGLMKVLDASSSFDIESLRIFVSGMLMQLANLLEIDEDDIFLVQRRAGEATMRIIAASGNYEPFIGDAADEVLGAEAGAAIDGVFVAGEDRHDTGCDAHLIAIRDHDPVVLFTRKAKALGPLELALVGVFCEKVALAYENGGLLEECQSDLDGALALLAALAYPSYAAPVARARHTGMLSRDIAEALARRGDTRLGAAVRRQLARAAGLCDLGNHELPASLWRNAGALSDEERQRVRLHPAHGGKLLAASSPEGEAGSALLSLAREIALNHHERYDGSGYPTGLAGQEIPLAARIVAVADAYIALTSPRPHRDALDHQEAIDILVTGSGSAFDPDVIGAFLDVADSYRKA